MLKQTKLLGNRPTLRTINQDGGTCGMELWSFRNLAIS